MINTNTDNKTVLIFDDDLELLELCTVILEKKGYTVKTSDNCNNILDTLKNEKPDVILMDNWIPDVGGVKATQTIKSSDFKTIPVIFFSANNDVKKLANTAGADAFITKPFNITDLEKVIGEMVQQNSTSLAN